MLAFVCVVSGLFSKTLTMAVRHGYGLQYVKELYNSKYTVFYLKNKILLHIAGKLKPVIVL
jgi:hypothetical protein